ncbi:hypothetical protein TI39_contig392g00001 [Zymoseptoria brevis]|uniref:Uncharacterized protein n=1 Tax=Zymoseptoria brevis TaxID=1047168 RepID=A0A0F4GND4_9PEZI|nr:hypothetical protein TI39_contig392g00001 [Zymoseptoria brevis]
MSTPKQPPTALPVNLTIGEQNILTLAWHCFTEMPKIDTKKLAQVGGFKNAASANAMLCPARKKLLAALAKIAEGTGGEADGDDDAVPATPKTPKSAGKKRAAAEEGGTPATGAKKKRRTKAEMVAAAAAAAGGDEDDEEQGLEAAKEDGDDVVKVLEGAAALVAEAGTEAGTEGETKIKGEEDDE